ncbi:MAG: efflux RND transporter periplasmic adaptor subunit [Pseudomonadota bacterium]|nr:efflux RND transporter periplasmic adaptor subunit [Pseudomonadota bacterium]
MQHPDAAGTGRRIRRKALILVGVLAVGFVAVQVTRSFHTHTLAKNAEIAASALLPVDVITVAAAPATSNLTLPGETAAWYESTIYARVDGYVANWSADIGDQVKKGQVLATIETPELDAQLAAAKAKLIAAQADAELAKTTYDRWRDSPKGVVSEQEREEKKAAYSSAVAQVKLSQAGIDRYQALARFKEVTAPYDGRITERRIDIGNLVTAGSNASTTPLYRMAQNNPMRIFVDVPQSAAPDMKKDVEAEITASNLPDRIFRGAIARTADAINPQSRTLRVEVDIPNEDQALVPGMYVNVKFEVPGQGLPQVRAAALVFRNGGPEVAVVDKDHRVHFHKVAIARDNGGTVDIGSGIEVGDQVALNISNQISDGDTVQVNAKESPAHAPAPQK